MIDLARLQELIIAGESLNCEFKSDRRGLSDSEIYEEVVALANTAGGGTLLIGVEDDGAVSGARPRHRGKTDPPKLQSAIFNNTVPSINTRINVVPHPDGNVIAIAVDSYPEPCATAAGKALRRAIGPDGKPQSIPFYPRDQRSRRVDLGLLDFSAQPLEDASFEMLDLLQFERLRQTIERLHGDQALIELSDQELAKALRLVSTVGDRLVPNVAGLLLLGRESVLANIIPTHTVHFQVLDVEGNVKVNDTLRGPLLQVIEQVESRFDARREEREVQVGLFRLPIPEYAPRGFREAVNNALLHRDYTRLGGVYVQWQPDHLLIANPGGFPEGVTIDNLLVHEPTPRNPRLAEAFKRIGLIEQTGRGIDTIYLGQLRYGRPAPDYGRSDAHNVRVVLRGGQPSLEFAAFVYEQDRQGTPLTLDALIVLNALFHERRIDSATAGRLIQKSTAEGRAILERLNERGLVEGRGERGGRVYHLSGVLYRRFHMRAEYVRAKGFEPLQHEQMVLDYAREHGRITRSEAAELCRLGVYQASRLLRRLATKYEQFKKVGQRRAAYYVWQDSER